MPILGGLLGAVLGTARAGVGREAGLGGDTFLLIGEM